MTSAPPRSARSLLRSARRVLPIAVVCCGATLLVASCGSSTSKTDDSPSPTVSSKGTPSPDPTALAKQEVADVFRHMREEEAKAYNLGYTSKTKFDRYAANPALGKTNSELFDYRQAGVIFTGKPKSEFEVTAIDLENNPHKATITECFDITGWRPVLKATGKDVGTKGQVSRYTITSTAQIVGQGTSAAWMITDYTVDKARTC